jgi:hypothetical protein
MDVAELIIGAVLTLLVFSYLLSDNVLYRWALALIVGAAVGYAAAIAVRFVALEWTVRASSGQDTITGLVAMAPLLLGCLLLFKGFNSSRLLGRLSIVGNIPLGYLVGAGAAVSVSGAMMGTILPLALGAGGALQVEQGLLGLLQGGIILLTTTLTLLAFSTLVRKQTVDAQNSTSTAGRGWRRGLQQVGTALIAAALGAAFAGALSSALTALVMRLWQLAALLDWLISAVGG